MTGPSSGDRNLGMFAIYDLVAGEIVGKTITLFPHVAPARRMFRDACTMDPEKSRIAQHPEDYALVYLGMVSIWTLRVVDVATSEVAMTADGNHPQVVCTGPQVLQ